MLLAVRHDRPLCSTRDHIKAHCVLYAIRHDRPLCSTRDHVNTHRVLSAIRHDLPLCSTRDHIDAHRVLSAIRHLYQALDSFMSFTCTLHVVPSMDSSFLNLFSSCFLFCTIPHTYTELLFLHNFLWHSLAALLASLLASLLTALYTTLLAHCAICLHCYCLVIPCVQCTLWIFRDGYEIC